LVSLHLTVEDMSRIRFIGTLGPDFETRLAEVRYADLQQDEFGEWRRKVRRRLRGVAAAAVSARARSLHRSAKAMSGAYAPGFQDVAVEPFWGRIRDHLALEREKLGRRMVSSGVDGVLNELHPAISWRAPFLRVGNNQEDAVELRGGGMVIAPSLFAAHPLFLDEKTSGQGVPVLVYNVMLTREAAAGIWQQEEDKAASLRDLLGHTRASVLESVRLASSTGEISRRLHISNPSASKHLGVLRRSGLVATERRNNLTLHRLTHLGEAVLGRQE
jgi:DNA-binding transcriptional ArsR family regulator